MEEEGEEERETGDQELFPIKIIRRWLASGVRSWLNP